MDIYSNIWKALNQTSLRSFDEEISNYPKEVEIDTQKVMRHFNGASQYKFIDLADLSGEDEEYLESLGLSLNYLKLNQTKVINSEGVVKEKPRTPLNFLELHLSMVEERFIYAICPTTGKVLKSNRSLPIDRFVSSCSYRFVGEEVFYLVLRKLDRFIKNFLYFPRIDLVVIFERGMPGDKTQQAISRELNFLKTNTVTFWQKFRSYLLGNDDAQTAIIVQNVNVLHYILNMLTGIQKLYDDQYLHTIDKFLVFGSEFYGAFDEIFPEISLEKIKRVKSSKNIFEEIIENNCFALRVLYGHCENKRRIMDDSLQRVMQLSRSKCSKSCLKKIEKAKNKHFPLLWINVRATKRIWLSQVEGTANIIKNLHSHFPDLGVVFDGFTRHEVEGKIVVNPKDEAVIEEENKLVRNIQSLLPIEIRTYNNIGCLIHESLLWAEVIDFSLETRGSSEVRTRIFNKPKVIHGSKTMMNKQALDGVIDVREGHWQTDYDFDWKVAYEKLFKIASELTKDYHLQQGNFFIQQGNLDKALTKYTKAVDIKPDDPFSYHELSEILSKHGHPFEAIQMQKKAISLDKSDPAIHFLFENLIEQYQNQLLLKNYNYKIISLGWTCLPRTVTTRWGLKPRKSQGEKSCPFDLAVHSYDTVCQLLDNNFEDYLNSRFLEIEKLKDGNLIVINKKYKCRFNHEKGQHWIDNDFSKLKDTYQKRINNFYDYIKSYPILFILEKSDNVLPEELVEIIVRKFPKLKFKLLVINCSTNKYPDSYYQHESIIPFHLKKPSSDYIWFLPRCYQNESGIRFERQLQEFIKISIIKYFD